MKPTPAEIDALPPRELDAMIAEKLGLPVKWSTPPYFPMSGYLADCRYPWLKGVHDGVEYDWAPVPHYSSDLAAAFALGEEMERLGMGDRYAMILRASGLDDERDRTYYRDHPLQLRCPDTWAKVFLVAHADALTRARAAARCLAEAEGNHE